MTNEQRILSTALDYIEGWYEADSTRMDRALSPCLAKRHIVSTDEIWHVDKAWIVEAAAGGNGRIEHPAEGMKEVTILDHATTMASVKIVSEKYIDCLHLAKCADEWSIVNILWDYRDA